MQIEEITKPAILQISELVKSSLNYIAIAKGWGIHQDNSTIWFTENLEAQKITGSKYIAIARLRKRAMYKKTTITSVLDINLMISWHQKIMDNYSKKIIKKTKRSLTHFPFLWYLLTEKTKVHFLQLIKWKKPSSKNSQ